MEEDSEGSKRDAATSVSDIVDHILEDDLRPQKHARHVSFSPDEVVDGKMQTPSTRSMEDEELEDKIKKLTEMSFDSSPAYSPSSPTRTRGDTDRRIGRKAELSHVLFVVKFFFLQKPLKNIEYDPAQRRA